MGPSLGTCHISLDNLFAIQSHYSLYVLIGSRYITSGKVKGEESTQVSNLTIMQMDLLLYLAVQQGNVDRWKQTP